MFSYPIDEGCQHLVFFSMVRAIRRWGLTLPLPMTTLADHEARSSEPRPPATPTSGRGETTDPTASRRWRSRRLDREDPARHRRRRRLPARPGPARPAGGGARGCLRRALRPRHRGVLGPDRRGLERHSVREAAQQGLRNDRLPAPGAGRRARRRRLQARDGRRAPSPIMLAALRGKMLRLAVEKADGAFTNFLPLARPADRSPSRSRARPRASSCSAASSACPARASRSSRSRASCSPPTSRCRSTRRFFRWLGHGETIDPMVEAWAAKDRQQAAGRRALGADRGHVHPRLARGDEGAPRRIRRGRHHAADPDPDHDARQAGELIEALAPQ